MVRAWAADRETFAVTVEERVAIAGGRPQAVGLTGWIEREGDALRVSAGRRGDPREFAQAGTAIDYRDGLVMVGSRWAELWREIGLPDAALRWLLAGDGPLLLESEGGPPSLMGLDLALSIVTGTLPLSERRVHSARAILAAHRSPEALMRASAGEERLDRRGRRWARTAAGARLMSEARPESGQEVGDLLLPWVDEDAGPMLRAGGPAELRIRGGIIPI